MQIKTQRDKFSEVDESDVGEEQRSRQMQKEVNDKKDQRNAHSLVNFQQKKNLEYEDADAQILLFRVGLLKHRNAMRISEAVVDFDDKWNLTMIQHSRGASGTVKGNVRFYFGTKSQQAMDKSIKACLQDSKVELKRFQSLPSSLRGPELLRIFFLDVIGRDTREYKVLQNNLYQNANYVVSWAMKCLAVALLFMFNLFMLYSILLYGASKGFLWQEAWALTAALNLCIDVFLNSFSEAFLLFYFIPALVTKDVLKVQRTVLAVIEKMFTQQLGNKGNAKKSEFSSTDYFYMSNAIAKVS